MDNSVPDLEHNRGHMQINIIHILTAAESATQRNIIVPAGLDPTLP